jgi:hypothetical protein
MFAPPAIERHAARSPRQSASSKKRLLCRAMAAASVRPRAPNLGTRHAQVHTELPHAAVGIGVGRALLRRLPSLLAGWCRVQHGLFDLDTPKPPVALQYLPQLPNGFPLGFDGDGDVTLRGYSRYPGFDRSSFRSRPGHARLLPNPRVTWLAAARMPPRMGSGIRINSCPPL